MWTKSSRYVEDRFFGLRPPIPRPARIMAVAIFMVFELVYIQQTCNSGLHSAFSRSVILVYRAVIRRFSHDEPGQALADGGRFQGGWSNKNVCL